MNEIFENELGQIIIAQAYEISAINSSLKQPGHNYRFNFYEVYTDIERAYKCEKSNITEFCNSLKPKKERMRLWIIMKQNGWVE